MGRGKLWISGYLFLLIAFSFTLSSISRISYAEDNALAMMKSVFRGGYTKAQIKRYMDKAMGLYGVPVTEKNYQRCASALVALRKSTNVKEMKILDYMIRSYTKGVKIDFPKAAAFSATVLQLGDK